MFVFPKVIPGASDWAASQLLPGLCQVAQHPKLPPSDVNGVGLLGKGQAASGLSGSGTDMRFSLTFRLVISS
ncbi:unnamed protein product [Penicillium camemberti]|uniref:Str. FM013 n=1 Tax=Penicillium camemberti (strain FM 013) TaxID=1429867 RepID=A0A0G4PF83_PENC3|nr:unnamed protein product [Penicillium camemberti]